MSDQSFDAIVVGAGPAGEVIAGRLAEGGLKTALVEDRLVGGECSYWACMPSKALLRAAQALDEVDRIPGAAEAVTGSLDVQAVLDRRDEVIHDLDDSAQLPWLEERDVTLVRGYARFTGEKTLQVGDDTLTGTHVVIAVGTLPAIPPVPGLREADPWTNREITIAKHVPARLVVLGGGVVGCEMAQAWSRLGSEVSLVEPSARLLGKEEPYAAEQVKAGLEKAGVTVHLGAKAASVSRPTPGGEVTVELEDGTTLVGDELLAATGRKPQTDDLGLETIGLEPGGYIAVEDDLTVPGHPWLTVIGDANGRALLTHAGKYQARIAARRILGDADAKILALSDGPGTPRVTFTEPQVAAVGLTEALAREKGLDVATYRTSTSGNAGGSFYGKEAPGDAFLVVDTARDVIVGATITGAEIQDMIQAATVAVVAETPLDLLWHTIQPFPTRSELWLQLLEKWEEDRRKVPGPA